MLRSRMVILICALVPQVALAAPTNPVRALRQEVAALQLDHALNLSQSQAQALLPLLQGVRTQIEALKAQRASSEPATVAALTQAVADLKANGTVSASTTQALQAVRGGTPGAFRQDVKAFWRQAKPVFTADQLQALRTTKLGVGQPTASASDGTSGGSQAGKHFHRRFRVMHTLLSQAFLSLVQARAG